MWPFDSRSIAFEDAEVQWKRGNRYRSALVQSEHYKHAPEVSFCLIVLPEDLEAPDVFRLNLEALSLDKSTTEFVVLVPHPSRAAWEELAKPDWRLNFYTYDPHADIRKLRNQAFQVSKGKILVSLAWGDLLPPRAARFIADEMTTNQYEQVVILERNWRRVLRMAIWRDTYFELGGFDERRPLATQCNDLICRAKEYGLVVERKTHENYVQTRGPKRPIWLSLSKPKVLKLSYNRSVDLIKPL